MTGFSILFTGSDHNIRQEGQMPDFFPDLNLDQVISAVLTGKREYDLASFYYTPLKDVHTIRYRQDVSKDLENHVLLDSIKTFAEKCRIMRRYLELIKNLTFKYHIEGWFLEAVKVYCEAVSSLQNDMANAEFHSHGFQAFFQYLTDYVRSERFVLLQKEVNELVEALAVVQYCVQIKDNRVRVRKYEGEVDYSAEIEKVFFKFKQGSVKNYLAKLPMRSGMNHIEAQILDFVAKLYPDTFKILDDFCAHHQDFLDETIRRFDREVQFYVAYHDFVADIKRTGLKFCYPKISSSSKEIASSEGFDIALANKCVHEHTEVVPNDFYLRNPERIIVVTGPNQGGKTTFARAFGQIQYLACLGLPVPGKSARLFLFDHLFTHFEKEEDIKNLHGKLQDDLIRIQRILQQSTSQSIIIMNEIFSSTTLKDAVFLSRRIFDKITQKDLICVCVTFMDELASMNEKTISMVSTVQPDNPAQRTFKIIRQPADGLAYALSIAEKYHLTYDRLVERIQK